MFCRYIIVGIFIFLFVYLVEAAVSQLLHKYRLFSYSMLKLSCFYPAIGAVFGLAFGMLAALTGIHSKNRSRIEHKTFLSRLIIPCFILFYVLVVMNAFYLSESSIYSTGNLFANILVLVFSIPLFLALFKLRAFEKKPVSPGEVISILFSTAIVLTVIHAALVPFFDVERPGLFQSGIVAFAYVMAATAIASLEIGVMQWGLLRKSGEAGYGAWKISAAIKVLAVLVCLSVAYYKDYAGPVKSEFKVDARRPKGTPNILLVVIDTLRQDRLSIYGCERNTSPNIARFAEEALVFDAYSPSTWTLPSHASLFTGRYPTETGTGRQKSYLLDPRNETLAELLARSGYRTGAIVANYGWLSVEAGFNQGFNYYCSDTGIVLPPFPFLAGYIVKRFFPDSTLFTYTPYMVASEVRARASKWIRKNSGQPFFLFLNFMDVHAPFVPPRPYDSMWNDRGLDFNVFRPPTTFKGFRRKMKKGLRSFPDAQRDFLLGHSESGVNYSDEELKRLFSKLQEAEHDFLLSQYDGEISYVDEELEKLFSKMKESGIYDKSLIIITSDHGQYFGEHGLGGHPAYLYQNGIHVPLIVKFPAGRKQAAQIPEGSVSLVHLFHSILNYVGITHDSGRKEVDLFSGESGPVIAEAHFREERSETEISRGGSYCLIENNLKVIVSLDGNEEAYNIREDPGELNNLAEIRIPETDSHSLMRMKSHLTRIVKEINAPALQPAKLSAEAEASIKEKVRALGYIE